MGVNPSQAKTVWSNLTFLVNEQKGKLININTVLAVQVLMVWPYVADNRHITTQFKVTTFVFKGG